MSFRKELPRVVRDVCLCCQGGSRKLVRECAQSECALHAFRDGAGDEAELHRAVAAFCLACAGSPEAVLECEADRPVGNQRPCPAHAFRSGIPAPRQTVRDLPGLVVPRTPENAGECRDAPPSELTPRSFPTGAENPGFSPLEPFLAPEAPDI